MGTKSRIRRVKTPISWFRFISQNAILSELKSFSRLAFNLIQLSRLAMTDGYKGVKNIESHFLKKVMIRFL